MSLSLSHIRLRQSGFTLIEIIVVIVIIGLLASMVAPAVVKRIDQANVTKAKADIRGLEQALESYYLDNFNYPSTEQGLSALYEKPSSFPEPRNWRPGGYIKRLPKDPWGNDYRYASPGQHGEFDVFSYGADNNPGGEGNNADVQNWNLE
jgi:general secretion pathway protein G